MTAQQARGGIVVASENFTDEVEAFAKANRIKLIGGRELAQLLKQAAAKVDRLSPSAATLNPNVDPSCPKCGSDMVKRMAKKGERAGQLFWGCSRYPSCKGIINT
jgi:restriction system protein